jgi:hypothetical protein
LLDTVEKDGLSTLTLPELVLLTAPRVKQREPKAEILRRYKVTDRLKTRLLF